MTTYSHNSNCITPVMTANDAPTPIIISVSNETGPNNLVYRAFDHQGGATEPWYYNSSGSPQWIKIDTGEESLYIVTSYTLTAANNNLSYPGMPTEWTIKGSNNDSDWDTLDTVSGETGWGNNEMRTFTPDAYGSYRYFSITMSAKEAGGYGWQINEFELIGNLALERCYLHARRDRMNPKGVSTQNLLG